MANLYRKAALDKISSPEQLDQAITVSSPLSWLAVAAVALIVAATLIWACCTEIQQTVDVYLINSTYYHIYSFKPNESGERMTGKLLCLIPADCDLSKMDQSAEIHMDGERIGEISLNSDKGLVLTDEQSSQLFQEHSSLSSNLANFREFEVDIKLENEKTIDNIPPYSVAQLVVGTQKPINYVFGRGD